MEGIYFFVKIFVGSFMYSILMFKYFTSVLEWIDAIARKRGTIDGMRFVGGLSMGNDFLFGGGFEEEEEDYDNIESNEEGDAKELSGNPFDESDEGFIENSVELEYQEYLDSIHHNPFDFGDNEHEIATNNSDFSTEILGDVIEVEHPEL